MADVTMPQLGETVTEGMITKWFKQVGDQVAEDEVLFEVSTDKVDSEVPSPVGGYVTEIKAAEGDTVDVGQVIAVVSDEAPATGGDEGGDATPSESSDEAAADESGAEPAKAESAEAEPAPASGEASRSPSKATAGALLSPLVRRLVNEHDLDPSTIEGSGLGGRVTRADVERQIAAQDGRGAAAPAAKGATSAPVPGRREVPKPAPRSGTGDTVEPLNNIRRRTGEHMVASKATSPHAVTAIEVDYENIERVRQAHREQWREEEGFSLTYLPFISRAVVDALRDFPHINASVGDGELVVHNYVNLAVAVDLDFEGLLAPVVHSADDMRLRAIARSIDDLAGRARSRGLSADDITAGTFTISNSGPFGTHMVLPIINQPQVAILSTDAITRKPVVVAAADGSEAIAIHSVGMLAMSWDHRAFDGAYAAAFLAEVRQILETRDWEAEI